MRAGLWTFVAALLVGFQVAKPDPVAPDVNTPRPIKAVDSVFIEDLTWMEVRDAMRAGKDTVIVATGGIEQNGPYLAANKHNVVLRGTTDAIARKLGNALVAPIVGFVPEGDIEPPGLHMKYPSTVSLREETYRALLTDICDCYRTHGFRTIVLLGDSGGNQPGMKDVAERLAARWGAQGPRIVYIPEYYNYDKVKTWLESQGIKQSDEGLHDDFAITAIMATVDPTSIRRAERIAAGKFTINGVALEPFDKTVAWGRKIIDFRAAATIAALKTKLAEKQ
jgi:creatinine amidohydrolase/Fe(II)-dependent formamide hydrolase-like protein